MDKPIRKRARLQDYNYSTPGYYFVTICTCGRKNILSQIIGDSIPHLQLTKYGKIAEQELLSVPMRYENVEINKYIIMPNHIHLIIRITERINPFPTKKHDISNIIGKYKAAVTRNVGNAFMHSAKQKIWQRSFHDHVIRGEKDYQKIWQYIDTNHLKWKEDCFYNSETEAVL